jgi:hypothetical protein
VGSRDKLTKENEAPETKNSVPETKNPAGRGGAVDARLFIVFDLSAAPPARHVTVMMVMVMPVRHERHEAFSLLHAPKWCQTVAL